MSQGRHRSKCGGPGCLCRPEGRHRVDVLRDVDARKEGEAHARAGATARGALDYSLVSPTLNLMNRLIWMFSPVFALAWATSCEMVTALSRIDFWSSRTNCS